MKKSPEQRVVESTRRIRDRVGKTRKDIGFQNFSKVMEKHRPVKETGEMGQHDIEPGGDAYEWAQAILQDAEAVASESGGKLFIYGMKPFDMYQGPYAVGSLFDQAVKVWGGAYEGQLSIEVGGVIRFGGKVIQANWDELANMIAGAEDIEAFFAAAREAGAMYESDKAMKKSSEQRIVKSVRRAGRRTEGVVPQWQERVFIEPGGRGKAFMPHSEVCIHMHVAGKEMEFELLPDGRSVQLYKDGENFSSPIGLGEAGIYTTGDSQYYYYPHWNDSACPDAAVSSESRKEQPIIRKSEAQQHRVSGRATTISTDDSGYTNVIYHSTPVVSFNDSEIKLNTGGWWSMTTKTRMNQASNQFKLGFFVQQKQGDWFVHYGGKAYPFTGDSMVLDRTTETVKECRIRRPQLEIKHTVEIDDTLVENLRNDALSIAGTTSDLDAVLAAFDDAADYRDGAPVASLVDVVFNTGCNYTKEQLRTIYRYWKSRKRAESTKYMTKTTETVENSYPAGYDRFDDLENLLNYFDAQSLLDEVIRGLSAAEAYDAFEYIRRMNDLPEFGHMD